MAAKDLFLDDEPTEGEDETGTTVPVFFPDLEMIGESGDEQTAALVDPETGEIIELLQAPDVTAEAQEIARYITPRLEGSRARLAGLRAEKTAHLEAIANRYDRRIKREESLQAFLTTLYREPLRVFAAAALEGGKARSLQLEGITLAFRKQAARLDIVDPDAAAIHLERVCPSAVRKTVTILKSAIPKLRREMLMDQANARDDKTFAGMSFTPATETFEVK